MLTNTTAPGEFNLGLDIPPTAVELPIPFDFHVHTCMSDGNPDQTPDEVCRAAGDAGIRRLSITDHDVMLPDQQRRDLAKKHRIDLVAGCEISCTWKVPGTDKKKVIHLGRHWGSAETPLIREVLRHNQSQDFEGYTKEMLSRLLKHGLDPSHEGVDRSYEMLRAANPDSLHLGKRAVANLLVATGCVASKDEVMDRYLGADGDRLAYVPTEEVMDFVPFEQAMAAANENALSTLNHLFYYGLEVDDRDALLQEFKDLGGQALEVVYTRYAHLKQVKLLGFCRKYGLLANAGSDRHDASRRFMGGPPELYTLLQIRRRQLFGDEGAE